MIMTFLRRNLTFSILKHASPVGGRSPSDFSFSVRLFSISTESQLGMCPNLLDLLLHRHNFPSELASRVAPELSYLKTPEKAAPILSFFENSGFSDAQLIRLVKKRPRFFMASLEDNIKPKIKIFRDLGLSSDGISKIISNYPAILCLSLKNNIIPSLSLLNGYLGSNDKVGRVISRYPRLLTVNLENTVVPNVEFLKSCGVTEHRISSVLTNLPNLFTIKPELVRKAAEKGEAMGIDTSSKNFVYAVLYIAALRNEVLELKLHTFRELGFSDSDIVTMLNRAPLLLSVSVEKIKKVAELVLATGKFDLSSIVDNPASLAHSIEKRYIPRLRILGILESRNLIEVWPSLASLRRLTDAEFFEKFISPYLGEISDLFDNGKNGFQVIR